MNTENKNIEIWRDVVNYEGLYQVSNFGNVKALGNGKTHNKHVHLLKQYTSYGYKRVGLCKDGKVNYFQVHTLVGKAFIKNENNLLYINHKDENKSNNHVENLEWCDIKYNCNYGTRNIRVANAHSKRVYQYSKDKTKLINTYKSLSEAERQTKIQHSHISECCNGKLEHIGGFYWSYNIL